MNWVPWSIYMTKKTAIKTFEGSLASIYKEVARCKPSQFLKKIIFFENSIYFKTESENFQKLIKKSGMTFFLKFNVTLLSEKIIFEFIF